MSGSDSFDSRYPQDFTDRVLDHLGYYQQLIERTLDQIEPEQIDTSANINEGSTASTGDQNEPIAQHNRQSCTADSFPISCCDTGYLNPSVSTVSSPSPSTDRPDSETATDGEGRRFDSPQTQKRAEAKRRAAVAKGQGTREAVFFSADILLVGIEPRPQGETFETIHPEKTRHRLIDLQYHIKQRYIPITLDPASLVDRTQDNEDLLALAQRPAPSHRRLYFPPESYNPKAYVSRHLQDNGGLAREVIIERLRLKNMTAPPIGQVLAGMNILPEEFFIPQVTPKGPVLFVNPKASRANNPPPCFPGIFPHERNYHRTQSQITITNHSRRKNPFSLASVTESPCSFQSDSKVPPGRKFPQGGAGPFFPLEMFDNEMYEVRTPWEWIQLGFKNSVQYPVPARAFLKHLQGDVVDNTDSNPNSASSTDNGTPEAQQSEMEACWPEVGVRSYDPADNVYVVSPVDNPALCYRVPRIYICFRAENATKFAQRVQDSLRRRKSQEAQLQYNLFVSSIPVSVESLPRLDVGTLDRIIGNITRGLPIPLEKRDELKRNVETLNARYFAKVNHRSVLENRHYMGLYHSMMSELTEEFHAKLPEVTWQLPRVKQGTVVTGGRRKDFDDCLKKLKTKFLFTQQPIIEAMGIVIENCALLDRDRFFVFDMPPLTLEEFHQAQSLQLEAIMTFIRGEWLDKITYGLVEYFTEAGNWYDVHVKRWDVYKISKLSVFIDLVKFNMESCVRNLLTRSIADFAESIEKYNRPKVNHSKDNHTLNPCDTDTSSPDEELFPIFLITLSMSITKGPFYTTPLEQFETVLEEILLKPIAECHRIEQPEPRLLTKFKFAKDTYLGSLGYLDKDATGPLEKLKSAVRAILEPLQDFAKQFEQYEELYNLNVEEYVRNFSWEMHPAVVVKMEIDRQLNYLDKLETVIPKRIIMGPFSVDVTDLKFQLVEKSQKLCDFLCESFEDRLSDVMREAMAPYETWYAPLVETHQALEKFIEGVERLDEIPELVQEQDKIVRKLQLDYEILDHFNYLMKEESYAIKYEALIWPYKIKTKLSAFVDKIEEEFERFKRNQIKDEVTLQEKLSALFTLFTDLVETQDIEKIHEFANEFRRAWKLLMELDAYAEVLNMRQDLLKIPITPFDQTKDLIADFSPYKDFWTSASEFLKMFQQWTERPLTQLNLSTIRKSFSDLEKVMKDCKKQFESMKDMLDNVQFVQDEMKRFRDNDLPILKILMDPCMTDEAWEEFGKAIGYDSFFITEKMSLSKFLKIQNVAENLELLKTINESVKAECAHENSGTESLEDSGEEFNVIPATESIGKINKESQSFNSLRKSIEDVISKEVEESIVIHIEGSREDTKEERDELNNQISKNENFPDIENEEDFAINEEQEYEMDSETEVVQSD